MSDLDKFHAHHCQSETIYSEQDPLRRELVYANNILHYVWFIKPRPSLSNSTPQNTLPNSLQTSDRYQNPASSHTMSCLDNCEVIRNKFSLKTVKSKQRSCIPVIKPCKKTKQNASNCKFVKMNMKSKTFLPLNRMGKRSSCSHSTTSKPNIFNIDSPEFKVQNEFESETLIDVKVKSVSPSWNSSKFPFSQSTSSDFLFPEVDHFDNSCFASYLDQDTLDEDNFGQTS